MEQLHYYQERDVRKLSGPRSRGRIGVSFDSSAGTVAALEIMLDLGGGASDNGVIMASREKSRSRGGGRPHLICCLP